MFRPVRQRLFATFPAHASSGPLPRPPAQCLEVSACAQYCNHCNQVLSGFDLFFLPLQSLSKPTTFSARNDWLALAGFPN